MEVRDPPFAAAAAAAAAADDDDDDDGDNDGDCLDRGERIQGNGCRQGRKVPAKREKQKREGALVNGTRRMQVIASEPWLLCPNCCELFASSTLTGIGSNHSLNFSNGAEYGNSQQFPPVNSFSSTVEFPVSSSFIQESFPKPPGLKNMSQRTGERRR